MDQKAARLTPSEGPLERGLRTHRGGWGAFFLNPWPQPLRQPYLCRVSG